MEHKQDLKSYFKIEILLHQEGTWDNRPETEWLVGKLHFKTSGSFKKICSWISDLWIVYLSPHNLFSIHIPSFTTLSTPFLTFSLCIFSFSLFSLSLSIYLINISTFSRLPLSRSLSVNTVGKQFNYEKNRFSLLFNFVHHQKINFTISHSN